MEDYEAYAMVFGDGFGDGDGHHYQGGYGYIQGDGFGQGYTRNERPDREPGALLDDTFQMWYARAEGQGW